MVIGVAIRWLVGTANRKGEVIFHALGRHVPTFLLYDGD